MTDHRPRFEILPPAKRERTYAAGIPSTRLGHEHDMNDAFGARMDWYSKFKNLEDQIKKEAEGKTKEGAQKDRDAKKNRFWPMLVFIQLFAILEIIILKMLHII